MPERRYRLTAPDGMLCDPAAIILNIPEPLRARARFENPVPFPNGAGREYPDGSFEAWKVELVLGSAVAAALPEPETLRGWLVYGAYPPGFAVDEVLCVN